MNEVKSESHGDFELVRLSGEVDLSWSQAVRREILDALGRTDAVGVELS
jgi:anti-sigma B factor antagonist